MFCPNCFNNSNFEIENEEEKIVVKGEEITICSEVTYCKNCGEKIWNSALDNNNLKKAYEIYKKNHKLLTSCEIRAIREIYGITQVTFAKILGLGDKTIARYENGAIQDEAHNNLILMARNINNFEVLFKRAKERLNDSEVKSIEDLLKLSKVSVISNGKYIELKTDVSYGGFTYEQQQRNYKFNNAV